MGELKNCVTCGKLFVRVAKNICPDCVEKEEQEYMQVRDFIKQHVNPTVDDITEATGVDENKILRWMREGRLEYAAHESSILGLTCKRCGTGIRMGEYCPSCVKDMVDQLSAANPGTGKNESHQSGPVEQTSRREGMFVADRLRKET